MPKITIREEDLTSGGVVNVTSNAVYIPGYSIMGPVNTPTLCNTLEEFESIFGKTPYVFEADQAWPADFSDNAKPSKKYAISGDMERSYIMASELLRNGLPVYFERVFPKNAADWESRCLLHLEDTVGTTSINTNLKLTASTPGKVGKKLYCTLTKNTELTEGNYYVLSVGRDADVDRGITAIPKQSTKFTFNEAVSREYTDIIYYRELEDALDNSGLVTLNFVSDGTPTEPVEGVYSFTLDQSAPEFDVPGMYSYLYSVKPYERFEDRGEYVLKFLTTGAYPVFEYKDNAIVSGMLGVAAERGDATAIIDHTPNNSRSLTGATSVYEAIKTYCKSQRVSKTLQEPVYSYGTMFTPYAAYRTSVTNKLIELPASFGYLNSFAISVMNNPNWYAVAGVTRGMVPNLVSLSQNVTNAIADSYTPRDQVSINPITNIKPYGYVVWGNRTLKNNYKEGDLTATSFLNIRQLVSDVKRTVFVASRRMTFEQDNDILWINFKSLITPMLDRMLYGNGITAYKLLKQKTNEKAKLKAKIILQCVEAVEDFDITISLTDSESTITE